MSNVKNNNSVGTEPSELGTKIAAWGIALMVVYLVIAQ
jgi:hypothetical protein